MGPVPSQRRACNGYAVNIFEWINEWVGSVFPYKGATDTSVFLIHSVSSLRHNLKFIEKNLMDSIPAVDRVLLRSKSLV